MSQTVEFAYKLEQTVRLQPRNPAHKAFGELGHVRGREERLGGGKHYTVSYGVEASGCTTETFQECELCRSSEYASAMQHVACAQPPAPTFPRVIWQDEKGAFPRRVVQTAPSDLIAEELRHRDAMGAELWTSVAMEDDWLTDALVCLALSVTKPAK